MKLHKISLFVIGGLVAMSCSDIDSTNPEMGAITGDQSKEVNDMVPERVEATFNGMFSMMAKPYGLYQVSFGNQRADDFGFITMALSQDCEGADVVMGDNGFNWFSAALELSTRNADYANPYIRYIMPYKQLGIANEIIASFPEDTQSPDAVNKMAQARAIRAFDYMSLAPYFQVRYVDGKELPCVPLLDGKHEYGNNPRATVEEVYKAVMEDLDYAVANLTADRSDKSKVNVNVAYGLRARAHLAMGMYAEAAADAEKAMEGYTPATMSEVSVPTFCNINEHNWIWGIDITDAMANDGGYATSSSWISAFSGDGYAPATGNVPTINVLLYDMISATDVRKGWWLDVNRHSDNWANLTWAGAQGDAIADLVMDDDSKIEFGPYTSIKFGQQSGVGSTLNNNDWPLMRVEEMILIQVEGLAKSGKESLARQVLENFVKTYRDPGYTVDGRGLTLDNEIWFQRRVELWCEGFFTSDARRLNKNIVRFHAGAPSNMPDAFKFNVKADDPWLNMRFCTSETNSNAGIIDNKGGEQPTPGQNADLKDGVTD